MIKIRFVEADDAQALLEIYAYYVKETAITFEYDVPSVAEFQERINTISSFYPYLVAVEDGHILGYAYASAFHPRAAYAWSAESTVYLSKDARGKGVGRKLYQQLEADLKAMGILNLNACIATTSLEDGHLDNTSQKFHEALGFDMVGKFHQSGYKFQTWYDMIWMEKMLASHDKPVQSVQSIHETKRY
ncbi:GNAT family N-acetyltransferase [Streptococcus loxodontisalivarius]|uniref:Phosphinothricin acetyltransferase n=1 Tax=Streptococcus loxodontisalivarius TaxID=1349415 RepID=A0ABS2PQ25_9STRE|nr:GNAT family N-acetyltransferase [Streptococcus loxodontisalivarius]MBM7642080.1 phosphinothricin acetyltransferase [Streptococcus loxodontisalivarius]